MINTIYPYFPLSTFNSITSCSSAAGSEVTLIPFLSKTSSGLDEKKRKNSLSTWELSKSFFMCAVSLTSQISPRTLVIKTKKRGI